MIRWPLFLSVVALLFQLKAQQIPQYTQWNYHQFALNPAFAGLKKCIDFHALYRTQWLGFDGAPKSGFVTFASSLPSKQTKLYSPRYGIGGKMETDQIGAFSFNRFSLALAGHFNFTQDNRLSLGINGGFQQLSYNPQNASTVEPDPSILQQANHTSPDASFGAWWNGKNYYIGFVIQNLIRARWENVGENSRYEFHYTLNGGLREAIGKETFLLPVAIIRIPPKGPVSFDINALIDYKGMFGFGIGYRNTDALLSIINFRLNNQYLIQYSFDFVLSPIGQNNIYSHELSLSFNTCKTVKTGSVSCPLFN